MWAFRAALLKLSDERADRALARSAKDRERAWSSEKRDRGDDKPNDKEDK